MSDDEPVELTRQQKHSLAQRNAREQRDAHITAEKEFFQRYRDIAVPPPPPKVNVVLNISVACYPAHVRRLQEEGECPPNVAPCKYQ